MRVLLVLTALFLALPAQATTLCYPSGLRIGIVHRPGREQLAIATDISGGSAAELADEYGGAHVLEHLWFHTPHGEYDNLNALYSDIGATTNAYTTEDSTQFLTVANKRYVRTILAVEIARLRSPLGAIDEALVETEKHVVEAELHERGEGLSASNVLLRRQLIDGDDPYHRSVGATTEQVATLGLAQLQQYARRQYSPANMSMVIIGDIKPQTLVRFLTAMLPDDLTANPSHPGDSEPVPCPSGFMPPEVSAATQPDLPESHQPWLPVTAAVDQETAVFGWLLPSATFSGSRYGLTAAMLDWHLGRVLKSPLTADCGTDELDTMTLLYCFVQTEDERPIQTAAIERAVQAATTGMWPSLAVRSSPQTSQWVARIYADGWRAQQHIAEERLDVSPYGYVSDVSTRFRRTNSLKRPGFPVLPEISDTGRYWLTNARMRSLLVKPPEGSLPFVSGHHASRGQTSLRTRDPELVTAEYLARFVVEPDLSLLRTKTLDNGLDVWILPDFQVNRIRMALIFDGDSMWTADPQGTRTAFELYEEPRKLAFSLLGGDSMLAGTQFQGTAYPDHWSYYLTTGQRPGWATSGFGQFAKSLGKTKSGKDAKAYWAEAQADAKQALENPYAHAYWARYGVLGPDLPVGFNEKFRADPVSKSALKSLGKSVFQPDRATLIIVGPVHEDTLLSLVYQHFSDWKQTAEAFQPPREKADETPVYAPERTVFVLRDERPRAQATVELACHIDDQNSTASWILESALNQDLNAALRSDRGLTYGVYADVVHPTHGPTLNVQTLLPHAKTGEALVAMFDTLNIAATDGLPANRLAQLKVEAARGTVILNQDGDELISLLEWWANQPEAEDQDEDRPPFTTRLAQLTPEMMSDTLSACAGHEVVTVVGDVEAVSESLNAAKIPFSVVDW